MEGKETQSGKRKHEKLLAISAGKTLYRHKPVLHKPSVALFQF